MSRRSTRAPIVGCIIFCITQTYAQLSREPGEVRFGYDKLVTPGKLFQNQGRFDEAVGRKISWREQPLSYKSMLALANDELDLGIVNSVDIARAFTRQLPLRLVWVSEELWDTEALLVHNRYHIKNDGTSEVGKVRTPQDLMGKTIGVTFGGTEHYALEAYFKEFQIPIVTNSLYQMRGCKYSGPPFCQNPSNNPGNNSQCKLLIPCHYSYSPSTVVNFVGMHREELREAWTNGSIHAVYAGWQERAWYEQTGHILVTSRELAKWGKTIFNGLVVSDKFLARTDVDARNFTANVIEQYARSNYYYKNNTKEFTTDYAGKDAVVQRIESVTDVPAGIINDRMKLLQIPTLSEQADCWYLGCGENGRVARALKDQAKFCSEIKLDPNEPKILEQSLRSSQLVDIMDQYSPKVDPQFVNYLLSQGIDGTYYLAVGAKVHLGYQITANYGRTTSLIIT